MLCKGYWGGGITKEVIGEGGNWEREELYGRGLLGRGLIGEGLLARG